MKLPRARSLRTMGKEQVEALMRPVKAKAPRKKVKARA
jgi:hypothetical protein